MFFFCPSNFRKIAKWNSKFKNGIFTWKILKKHFFMEISKYLTLKFWIQFCNFPKIAWAKKISIIRFLGQFLKNMVTKFFRNSKFSNFLGNKTEISHLSSLDPARSKILLSPIPGPVSVREFLTTTKYWFGIELYLNF